MSITYLPDVFEYLPQSRYTLIKGRTKQTPPYTRATAYSKKELFIVKRFGTRGYGTWTVDVSAYPEEQLYIDEARQYAHNKAYERFVAKLGDSSSFGATLTAERRETFGMITGFVTKAYLATRAARRGDILGVFKELSFYPPIIREKTRLKRKRKRPVYVTKEHYVMPDGRTVLKESASAWLLWSYGISPLLDDIQNATEVFIREVPQGTRVFASAKEPLKRFYTKDDMGFVTILKEAGEVRVGITSKVAVENYDLWLLNQLGLVNPLQFANEAVPFSFVIDWASNWSSVINSLSDFMGLTLSESCASTKITLNQNFAIYNTRNYDWYGTSNGIERDCLIFNRTRGIDRPKLMFRYERFQWQRALNAISSLVGFLPSKTKK